MSVIAYDGNFLAVDRMSCYGGLINEVSKIRIHTPTQSIYAFNGNLDYAMEVYEYFKLKETEQSIEWPKFQNMPDADYAQTVQWVWGTKKIFTYDRVPYPMEYDDDFLAWGSGAEIATGAMAAGADAIEAVKITCQHINSCGKGIDVINLKTLKRFRISEKKLYS